MSGAAFLRYRDQLVRALVGECPAIMVKEADTTALDRLCQRLADAEEATQLLCANGYGWPSQPLPDLVRAVLDGADRARSK